MAHTVPPVPAPPVTERRGSRWRAIASAICIVLASILVPISVISGWARAELVDEDAFVQTFAPLSEDPAVQDLIITQATTAIGSAVDITSVSNDLFDGLATLPLPPKALNSIDLLRGPAAAGAEAIITGAVTKVVTSDAFSTVWRQALITSHRALDLVGTGGNGALEISADGSVGIDLEPIVAAVKSQLTSDGFSLASAIPSITATVVVARSDALGIVNLVYSLSAQVGYWLPLAVIALFAIGILLARRRSVAVLGTGLGLAIGGGVVLIGLGVGDLSLVAAARQAGITPEAMEAVYGTVVNAIRASAVMLVLLGVVVALAGWLAGRSRGAARVRSVSATVTGAARDGLARAGVNTGGFGEWLYRRRVWVRSGILIIALIVLFLLRPLSAGEVTLVVLISLLVWLLTALLERPPAPQPATPVEANAAATAT